MYDIGKDFNIFVQDLLKLTKDNIISYYVNNDKKYDIDILLKLSMTFNNILSDMKKISDVKTLIEINLISFINQNIINTQKIVEKVIQKEETVDKKEEKVEKKVENPEEKEEPKEENISKEIIIEDKDESYGQDYIDLIINNCFARATKENKKEFERDWKKLGDYSLDSKFGAVSGFLTDANIRVVGDKEILLSFEYESMVNRGIGLISSIKKLLKKIYNKDYDVALITDEKWDSIKNEYIENKNKGVTYDYIPISKLSTKKENKNKEDNITNQAIELFGEDIISVN